QEYIRANEEDFLTFKVKLLLKDAAGDPIKKGYIKKGSLSIGIKGKKSLVRVQKRGKVPVRLHFFS
ncbi:hypothetical protein, partial [Acidaminococcus intestini]|uniref:hypothetical protein n=1 Tax=Acidaminococcus intestini TaxID=187327 RepID=UPI003AB60E3E